MATKNKISNKNAREYVNNKEHFTGNNIFAEWKGNTYTIYSYGTHFPMYVYDQGSNMWIGNAERYSQSTSRHQSQARPNHVDKWVDTESLKKIVVDGIVGYCMNKVLSPHSVDSGWTAPKF